MIDTKSATWLITGCSSGFGRIVENIDSATDLAFEMLMTPVLSPMILR
jgi:hypothetical protein